MFRRLSLRVRMVLVAAAVVTVVLAAGGVILLLVARSELIEDATDLARDRAGELATLAVAGELPDVLPVLDNDEDVLQVVSGGEVVTASANLENWPSLDVPLPSPGDGSVHRLHDLVLGEDDDDAGSTYVVVASGFTGPDGPGAVFVGFSMEEIDETIALEARIDALGLPVIIGVLAAAIWLIMGRTLASVEAIRAQTEQITGSALDRRVPEPRHRDEIGNLARTVNAMLARLQESAERQRRFVADAAHELRSPVASLRTQLETAHDATPDEDQQRRYRDLLEDTQRMERLVDQLLLLARIDGAAPTSRRSVDLDDVIDSVIADTAVDRVTIDLSGVQPVQVIGDAALLEQLVRNLVDNAVTHAERYVRVALRADGDHVLLTVGDDGPGIPVERRDDVFHPFTRLDTARDRHSGGVGLGLAIVADVARSHGGAVSVGISPAGGAEFQVRLPR